MIYKKNKVAVLAVVAIVAVISLGVLAFSNINITAAFDGPPDSAGVGSGAFAVDGNGNVSVGTTTFSSAKLRVAGSVESTNGGFVFPDGSVQTTASGGSATSTPAGYVTPGTFNSVAGTGGNYGFPASIVLSTTTNSSAGVIYKGADRFIHDFAPAGSFGYNTFVGVNSGNFNMSGVLSQSSRNTAVGSHTLYSNSTGMENFAGGSESLYSNTIGSYNTAVGSQSLGSNISGDSNTAVGSYSLRDNTTGNSNTAHGSNTLSNNTTGSNNIAGGNYSLFSNTTGSYNTANGSSALQSNATGNYNTAVGMNAGYNSSPALSTMTNSTFLGYNANSSADGVTNSTALGAGAQVTKSNQVVLGNGSVTETLLRGNVGIGTTAPTSQLQVSGSAGDTAPVRGGGTLYLYDTGWGVNHGGAIVFGGLVPDTTFAGIKGLMQDAGGNTVGDLGFYTRGATGNSDLTERMRITSEGYVGIGTADPKKLLHLESSSTTLYMTNTTNSQGATIILEDTDGAGCTGIRALNGVLTASIVACP